MLGDLSLPSSLARRCRRYIRQQHPQNALAQMLSFSLGVVVVMGVVVVVGVVVVRLVDRQSVVG